MGSVFKDNYVLVKLDVQEQKDKTATLENPGGQKLMKEWGGENSGLPFMVFLDAKGKKLADSNALPGDKNIGYPAAPEEITAFEKLLVKTAPRMTAAPRARIIDYLKTHAPKQ